MFKHIITTSVIVCTLALSACNSTKAPQQQVVAQEPSRARLVSDPNFKLPEGTGCSGNVNRFRAIIDNDLETGHTTKTTHTQMSAEVDRAAITCSSGNDTSARSIISSTRAKFGYPAG
jgi:hypothetical protein